MIVLSEWLLTAQRVAIHLPTMTAVVADLHLGYAEARRRAGEAVPVVSLADALAPLAAACQAHGTSHVVVAGDLLEDGRCVELLDEMCAWAREARLEVSVIPGNHDRRGGDANGPLAVYPEGFRLGRWLVVHGDGPTPEGGVVQGHEHPCVRWAAGTGGPCFLIGEERLVLPAYSQDAAGVNVRGVRAWGRLRCCVVAGQRVLDLGPVSGLPRRLP